MGAVVADEGVSLGLHAGVDLSLALLIATFAAPFQVQLVVDQALYSSDADLLTVLALGFGALALAQAGLEALRNWALRIYGQLFTFQVMGNLVRHLLRLPADFFEKRHLGDILSRLGSVQPIQDAITRGLMAALIDGVMALAAAVVLFFILRFWPGSSWLASPFSFSSPLPSITRHGGAWSRRLWPRPRRNPS